MKICGIIKDDINIGEHMNKILGKTFQQIKPYKVRARSLSVKKIFYRTVVVGCPIEVIGSTGKNFIIVDANTGSLQLACRVNYYRLRKYFKEV